MSRTFTVSGSHGQIVANALDGYVEQVIPEDGCPCRQNCYCRSVNGVLVPRITRFDVAEYESHYDILIEDEPYEIDILRLAYWTSSGFYVAPSRDICDAPKAPKRDVDLVTDISTWGIV